MRLPRDLSGEELAVFLGRYDCEVTRQTGSHMRLSTTQAGKHHIAIPRHGALRVGTLRAIFSDVAEDPGIPKHALVERLFAK